jgi:hypothetical protein
VLGPEILEFDQSGTVLKGWGSQDFVPGWPSRLQSFVVDREGNIWISGTDPGDSIIKLNNDGKLLWDFGHRWPKGKELKQDNQQTDLLMGIEDFDLDEDAHEIYIADGARNKRVLVYDMNTGAFKRGWEDTVSRFARSITIRRRPMILRVRRRISKRLHRRCTASTCPRTDWFISANAAPTASRYSRKTAIS